jgi:hypothetical protein
MQQWLLPAGRGRKHSDGNRGRPVETLAMGGGFGFGGNPTQPGDGKQAASIFSIIGKRFNYSSGWTEATRDTLAEELKSRGLTPDDAAFRRREGRRRVLVIALAAIAAIVFAWGLLLWRGG